MKIKNKVIVIGGNHHNTLGVIRALGEKGVKSYVIITNDNRFSFVKKSKYIIKSYIVKESKNEILNTLLNNFELEKDKTIVIPTSDFAAITIDDNLDKLKDKFIVPQINNIQGMIGKYMDKYVQYQLAENYNIAMAKSYEIDLVNNNLSYNYKNYPYIVKPIISAYGSKADMRICHNGTELEKAIAYCKSKNFPRVLIQEFIDYDYEIGLLGCVHCGKVILPGIVKKIRRYPKKYGTTSYAIVYKKDIVNSDFINDINKLLLGIHYSGMYDMDVFVKNGKYYLNEINFRNSGNSIVYCYDNIYLVYLWILMITDNSIDNEQQEITHSFSFIDEFGERNLLFSKNITLLEYMKTKKISKARLFHRKGDLKPSVYKNIYAVCRRIFK